MRLGALSLLTLAAVPVTGAGAQQVAGSRAAVFLTLPAEARALALGEAWGAVAGGSGALFYNPAQLARTGGLNVAVSVQRYVAQTTLASLAVAMPAARGTFALGVRYLDYGSTAEYQIASADIPETGVPTGQQVAAQDLALTAGYGVEWSARGRVRLGASVTWAQQHVANYSGSAVAADVGMAYTTRGGWDVAAAVQDAGSSLTLAAVTAPLPLTWRVGMASPALHAGDATFRPMAEVRQVSGDAVTGVLALEGTWRATTASPELAGRAGWAFRGAGDDRSPLTAGLGVRFGRIAVDYAYEGFDLMGGATHRVGISYSAAPDAR